MGNCLVLQEKVVRVMKPDGKILEYKSPIKVHQVLSGFSHHAISDKLPVTIHMHPNADMHQGHLYYLLPLPLPPPQQPVKKMKKKVRFSDDVKGGDGVVSTSGVVRIKLVISKQELRDMMLGNGGLASVDDMMMISHLRKEAIVNINESCNIDKDVVVMPPLENIPEVN